MDINHPESQIRNGHESCDAGKKMMEMFDVLVIIIIRIVIITVIIVISIIIVITIIIINVIIVIT